ncbi:hypothetical protein Lacal_1472 [Lacinutrix sp. 5H-3-7-4]|nr:hypothetical protein Lacal_1472 [Lacinutrix sp. 5H-3-7-4]
MIPIKIIEAIEIILAFILVFLLGYAIILINQIN